MNPIEHQKLEVAEAVRDDIYKDIVRIHWRQRGKGSKVGAIVAVSVDRRPEHFFSLRGLADQEQGKIRMDHVARSELHVNLNEVHEFAIRKTTVWEKLLWAVRATDPAARIAAWIAVWSGVIGILSLVIGIIGLWPVIKELRGAQKSPSSEIERADSSR